MGNSKKDAEPFELFTELPFQIKDDEILAALYVSGNQRDVLMELDAVYAQEGGCVGHLYIELGFLREERDLQHHQK